MRKGLKAGMAALLAGSMMLGVPAATAFANPQTQAAATTQASARHDGPSAERSTDHTKRDASKDRKRGEKADASKDRREFKDRNSKDSNKDPRDNSIR